MSKKYLIDMALANIDGVIIMHKSGVHYSNQTGGHMCQHPEEEGVLAPVTLPEKLKSILVNCYPGDIDTKTHKEIDKLIGPLFKLDPNRLRESMEAWLYVRIHGNGSLWQGFKGCTAVLTWANSD